MKKGTVGSVIVHHSTSETELTKPYEQISKGVDAESFEGKLFQRGESPEGQVIRVSEITVENSAASIR